MKKYLSKLSSKSIFRFVLAILCVGFSMQASASHFRYGYISWSRDAINPLKIHFKVTQAWRRGFDYRQYLASNPPPPTVLASSPAVGNQINFNGNFPLNFGDGFTAN